MKKIVITTLLCCLVCSIFAQKKKPLVPGYRGLKFTIKYDLGMNLSWGDVSSAKMPVFFHNAEIAYVISRKYEISVRYARTDFKSPFSSYSRFSHKDGVGEYTPIDKYTYTGNSVSAICKSYYTGRGYIAPVGRYLLFGVTYIHSTYFEPFRYQTEFNGEIGLPSWSAKKITSHDIYATVGVGRSFILINRLVLSLEAIANIPITGLAKLDLYGSSSDYPSYLYETNIDNMLKNFIQLKVGLGVLAF